MMKKWNQMNYWLTGLIFLALTGAAQAQTKIATVDLQRVFDNYYKTKIADRQLKDQGSEFENTLKSMYDDYESLNEEYKALREKANNQIISADEREKRQQEAQEKLRSIKELEGNIQQWDRTAKTTLAEKQRRLRENILREIQEIVATKARTGGYGLVFDTAALSRNETPIVLYTDKSNDLTEEVLTSLNASAPPEYQGQGEGSGN